MSINPADAQYANIIEGCGAVFRKCHELSDNDIRQIVGNALTTDNRSVCIFYDEFCKDNALDLPIRFPGISFLSAVQLAIAIFSNVRAEPTVYPPNSKSSLSQRQHTQGTQSQMISHTGRKRSYDDPVTSAYPIDNIVKDEKISLIGRRAPLTLISPRPIVLSLPSLLSPALLLEEQRSSRASHCMESWIEQIASNEENVDLESDMTLPSTKITHDGDGNVQCREITKSPSSGFIGAYPEVVETSINSDLNAKSIISERKSENLESLYAKISTEEELPDQRVTLIDFQNEEYQCPGKRSDTTAATGDHSRIKEEKCLSLSEDKSIWLDVVRGDDRAELLKSKRVGDKSDSDDHVGGNSGICYEAVRVEADFVTRNLIAEIEDCSLSRMSGHGRERNESNSRDVRCFCKNMVRVVDSDSMLSTRYMESVLPKESEREIQLRLDADADERRENFAEEMFADRYT